MKAIGYIRVSTEEQARDGQSLERQQALIRAESDRQHWELTSILRDEGVSGGKPAAKRPGFSALTDAIRTRAAEVVVVSDISRLSRSQKDTLIFIEDVCLPSHAHLYAIDKGFIENNTVSGTMDLTLRSLLAEVYRKEISEKTLRAMAFKRQRGELLGGSGPFGFCSVDNGKRRIDRDGQERIIFDLVPLPEEQATIHRITALHKAGASLAVIARILTTDLVPTKQGNSLWYPSQIKRLVERKQL
jgi:DNA invertase Pin-like site-specific DNA recombinase